MRFRSPNARERMETACQRLLDATREITTWEWDDSCVAAKAAFDAAHERAVLLALEGVLPHAWGQIDIGDAPEAVRHVAGVWGGVMPGQRLFVLDPDMDPIVFATWWPWGDRINFSLRVSCAAMNETVAKMDPQAKLRSAFGL